MPFELYVWTAPRDVGAADAARLVTNIEAAASSADGPFEPSVDLGWFVRELIKDEPNLELGSDVPPSPTNVPIWLAPADPPPVRWVGIRLPADRGRSVAELVFGLAAKYDLVVYDAVSGGVVRPLDALAAHASATFWPGGAIRAAAVGALGLVIAIAAWTIGVPIVSGVVAVAGGFAFVMAVVTFAHELRVRSSRRTPS